MTAGLWQSTRTPFEWTFHNTLILPYILNLLLTDSQSNMLVLYWTTHLNKILGVHSWSKMSLSWLQKKKKTTTLEIILNISILQSQAEWILTHFNVGLIFSGEYFQSFLKHFATVASTRTHSQLWREYSIFHAELKWTLIHFNMENRDDVFLGQCFKVYLNNT